MLHQYLNAFQGAEHEAFTLHGGNQAALLIHGFPGTPAEMRPIADVLHQEGWSIHAPLLPGFGTQIETLAERKQGEWAQAIRTTLNDMQQTYDTVILVGLSMGGALAIEAAAKSDTILDGLVLLAPFWKVNHIAWTMMPALKVLFPQPRIFKWLRLDFSKQEVRDGIHKFMPELDLDDPEAQQAIRDFPLPIKMFAQIHKAGQLGHKHASQITVPTLVLQGTHDDLVQPKMTKTLMARFNGITTYKEFDAEHVLTDTTLADWPEIAAEIRNFATHIQLETEQVTS